MSTGGKRDLCIVPSNSNVSQLPPDLAGWQQLWPLVVGACGNTKAIALKKISRIFIPLILVFLLQFCFK